MNDQHDLTMVLDSHFPIVTVQTHEEKRTLNLLKQIMSLHKRALHTWSVTEGIKQMASGGDSLHLVEQNQKAYPLNEPHYNHPGIDYANPNESPEHMLKYVKKSLRNTVLALLDFHPYMDDSTIIRLIKEIALDHSINGITIVFVSHALNIPGEIQRLCASFEMSLPNADQLNALIEDEAKVWAIKNKNKVKADKTSIELMVRNLMGLTTSDARRLIRNAIYDDGAVTQNDLPNVMKAKYELIGQDGVLSFEYDTAKFTDIGGFGKLLDWLEKRRDVFLEQNESHSDIPKGILLLGIQGSGKSLAAKAVAGAWQVPLLRLDFGALYNKFFGETEKNIRESLKTAEVMSPCVLWMDEIEKGIATGAYDSGTSKRVLASLLTWMAENKKRVFIVATANDIESLPPELIRKGRMDEIFFVDLPDHETRQAIFNIHITKRNVETTSIDLTLLATQSEGFSGAEIEQSVVAALYSALARKTALRTDDILNEINATQPLSVVMAEKIEYLRNWANNRTVPAN